MYNLNINSYHSMSSSFFRDLSLCLLCLCPRGWVSTRRQHTGVNPWKWGWHSATDVCVQITHCVIHLHIIATTHFNRLYTILKRAVAIVFKCYHTMCNLNTNICRRMSHLYTILIRQKTGAQNIVKEIKQYQKKWLQHVQRMDTNRLAKQTLQYKPKGRRNIGRPRKRWGDQIHLEDQGTGNTPNASGTWWWWWWNVLYTLDIYTGNMEWKDALIWKPWTFDRPSEIFHDSK